MLQTVPKVLGAFFDGSSFDSLLFLRKRFDQRVVTKIVDHARITLGIQEHLTDRGLAEYAVTRASNLQAMGYVLYGFRFSQRTNM